MESPTSQILWISLFFFNECCCFPYNNGFIIVLNVNLSSQQHYHTIDEVSVSCEIK